MLNDVLVAIRGYFHFLSHSLAIYKYASNTIGLSLHCNFETGYKLNLRLV